MGSQGTLDVSQLFAAAFEQVHENLTAAALAVFVLVAGNLALDYTLKSGGVAAAGFLSLGAQYYVIRASLNRAGLLPAGFNGRFASFWGMNIMTGLAILLGCVLFILPGAYLAGRWLVAGPAILAGDKTAGEGMRESWESMKPSRWHAVGALLIIYCLMFGFAVVQGFIFPNDDAPFAVKTVIYAGMFSASVFAWLMAVGAYRLVANSTQTLAEVFA